MLSSFLQTFKNEATQMIYTGYKLAQLVEWMICFAKSLTMFSFFYAFSDNVSYHVQLDWHMTDTVVICFSFIPKLSYLHGLLLKG